MIARPTSLVTACLVLATAAVTYAQTTPFGRLPTSRFDVTAPSARVAGAPGTMTTASTTCRAVPAAAVRQRIVDLAVQEWAYFGFNVIDRSRLEAVEQDDDPQPQPRRRRPRLPADESARLAGSIAGYWTATPSAGWVLARQNEEWKGEDGVGARWQYPWSAAFISWLMCEGGLGNASQFQRAAAHHVYIDQAIRARGSQSAAAYVAYEVGETSVEPGDLLCSARRPAYKTVAERQRKMGEGARTHCDVVVRVDLANERVLAIGGNVGGRVSLKMLPGTRAQGTLKSKAIPLGRRGMSAFAHLKLRGTPVALEAMDSSPTLQAFACAGRNRPPQFAILDLPLQRTTCTE